MNLPSFSEFFAELNENNSPFPWQNELATAAANGTWPDFISVPTGSGKTTCLEIAVYALACQAHLPPLERTAPRRIFFIVNRRVIVDEAFRRAQRMVEALSNAREDRPACSAIAEALRTLNPVHELFSKRPPPPPLDCVQLRGAIFRDQRWVRSLLQPTLVASTVDQVGSRLLFRGYGVTPQQSPIHAALVAIDALWLLDEAHISQPFSETIEAIQRYRQTHERNNPEVVKLVPLRFVRLTATPPENANNRIELSEEDRAHPVLSKRLNACKPTLLATSEKGELTEKLRELVSGIDPSKIRSIAIMVNRVATAKEVYGLLAQPERKKDALPFEANVSLLIGRMRPIDRDVETAKIQQALENAAGGDPSAEKVEIVVATQCLEVGADLDFDALFTECASLDTLRQRFGRLNRKGRDIETAACIVMSLDKVIDAEALEKLADDDKSLDPLYGKALPATWNWLRSIAQEGSVDFGINAMRVNLPSGGLPQLQAPTSCAPVLFPSYLDAWAQTNPIPWPDPDPALFLHGKQDAKLEVLVCWRADLDETNGDDWRHIVSLCPPSQMETLPVPLTTFKRWFFKQKANPNDDTGDLLAMTLQEETGKQTEPVPRSKALLWKGLDKSSILTSPKDLHPGSTIVLPVTVGGWNELGHIPGAPRDPANSNERSEPPTPQELLSIDVAEQGFLQKRDRAILRLHPSVVAHTPESEAWKALWEWATNPESDVKLKDLRSILLDASNHEALPVDLVRTLRWLSDDKYKVRFERYPKGKGVILTTRKRIGIHSVVPQFEDEADNLSSSGAQVTVRAHTEHVVQLAKLTITQLGLDSLANSILEAARLHDWGKLDPRFQALLLGGNPHAAFALSEPLAKSGKLYTNYQDYESARQRAQIPKGFRHEFASLQLAERSDAIADLQDDERTLALHLIAAHHGYGRPFAPVVIDDEPPTLSTRRLETPAIRVDPTTRREHQAHRIDSGVAERFWMLLRQHGWWGLAYLESILRLADQQASEAESEGWYAGSENVETPNSQLP